MKTMKTASAQISAMLFCMVAACSSAHAADPVTNSVAAAISTNLMTQAAAATNTDTKLTAPEPKPKFTKEQVKRRLNELKDLLDQGLILQDFYDRKVKECDVAP